MVEPAKLILACSMLTSQFKWVRFAIADTSKDRLVAIMKRNNGLTAFCIAVSRTL